MSHSNRTDQSTLIIIPSYNAARTLTELIPRLRKSVNLPILVVDDGSSDDTAGIAADCDTFYIRLQTNHGKGAALRAGFKFAIDQGYDAVITLDADLQHLPEEVPRFLNYAGGRMILVGTRRKSLAEMPFGRWVSNNLTSIILSIFSNHIVRDSQSGFRLIPTAILKQLQLQADRYDLESELLFKACKAGYKVVEVPVSTVYSDESSHIAAFRDVGRFIRQVWKRIWL